MKKLLFLSFLLNISCFGAEKSEEEEEEEEEEGDRHGDCFDGIDNDDDGDIDCDDSGCEGKLACDPDAINGAVQISGYLSQRIDYGEEYEGMGYSDCESYAELLPAGEAPHAASCPNCYLTGLSEYYSRASTTCEGEMPETMEWGIDRATETLYYYTSEGEWSPFLSAEVCTENSESYLTDDWYEGNCWTIDENGNDYTTGISLEWTKE